MTNEEILIAQKDMYESENGVCPVCEKCQSLEDLAYLAVKIFPAEAFITKCKGEALLPPNPDFK